MIRVLIAEDSATIAVILKKVLSVDKDIEIVAVARNGRQAVEMTKRYRPDIITMDIRMPIMNGFEATKQIMQECATPIVVISASVEREDLNITFNAIRAGALDVIEKPKGSINNYKEIGKKLTRKLKVLSHVKVFHHVSSTSKSGKTLKTKQSKQSPASKVITPPPLPRRVRRKTHEAVFIGSSTGGPTALLKILRDLPENFPVPIFIVQHISEGFGEGLVTWLNNECAIHVKTGEDGEHTRPGRVYVAPDNHHMYVDKNGIIELDQSPPFRSLRPSATVLMNSAAHIYGSSAVGVILTGMGNDGAAGIKAIKDAGGFNIAQDEETSVVFGMPKEAIALGGVDIVLPIDTIAAELKQLFKLE